MARFKREFVAELGIVNILQWVIFAAVVCIVTGMAYEIDASHALASLVVTTYNPACTAVFLSGYNVTRQSDLLYNYEYHTNDYLNGNNITYTTYADEVSELVALLAARWEVTKVVAHSADEPPRLLAQLSNPDVSIFYGEYSQSLQMARFKREFVAELGIVNILLPGFRIL